LASIDADRLLDAILDMRNRHFFAFDILAALITPALALSLRMDGLGWWSQYGQALMLYYHPGPAGEDVHILLLGLYRRYWRYASVDDLIAILVAVALADRDSDGYRFREPNGPGSVWPGPAPVPPTARWDVDPVGHGRFPPWHTRGIPLATARPPFDWGTPSADRGRR